MWKKYKSKSGFYKHNLKCETFENEIIPSNNIENLLKMILEENQAIHKKMILFLKKIRNCVMR